MVKRFRIGIKNFSSFIRWIEEDTEYDYNIQCWKVNDEIFKTVLELYQYWQNEIKGIWKDI
jgi:hypothetical protein